MKLTFENFKAFAENHGYLDSKKGWILEPEGDFISIEGNYNDNKLEIEINLFGRVDIIIIGHIYYSLINESELTDKEFTNELSISDLFEFTEMFWDNFNFINP